MIERVRALHSTRNKGEGKGKRPERNKGYQSDMYRNQAEEEEDIEEDFKPKGGKESWRKSNNWDRPRSLRNPSRSPTLLDLHNSASRVLFHSTKSLNSVMVARLHPSSVMVRALHVKLRMYYVRLFGGDDAEAINPYYHTLIVGYERSIIEYLEDTTAKLQQALCDLTYEDLHDKQATDVQNWFYAVAFPEDILAKNLCRSKV